MGTHPIFESDFDCLTESINRKCFSVDDAEWHRNQYYEVEYIFIQLERSHVQFNTEKTKIFSIQLLISKKILGYLKKKIKLPEIVAPSSVRKEFQMVAFGGFESPESFDSNEIVAKTIPAFLLERNHKDIKLDHLENIRNKYKNYGDELIFKSLGK